MDAFYDLATQEVQQKEDEFMDLAEAEAETKTVEVKGGE